MPTLFEPSDLKKKPASHPHPQQNTIPLGSPHPMAALASYALQPNNVRFETQEAEETVVLFLRQHPIVNLPWIIVAGALVITPVFLFPILSQIIPIEFAIPAKYALVGTLFWYLATAGFVLTNFLYWFFNIYIVTNERVVDIDFLYLLYKRFSQAELLKIQDLSYTSGGLVAALFDYGTVSIQTAGETPNLRFELVRHPEKIVETIRSLTEAEEEKGSG